MPDANQFDSWGPRTESVAPRRPTLSEELESDHRRNLKQLAYCQKGVLFCILFNFIALISFLQFPEELRIFVLIGYCINNLAAAGLVIMLAIKVYGMGSGIMMGIGALMPCIGLIILLIVNNNATILLRKGGIRVGLLGAKLGDLRRLGPS